MQTFTYVGKPLPRIEGTEKVTGKRMYTVDVQLPRMVHRSEERRVGKECRL